MAYFCSPRQLIRDICFIRKTILDVRVLRPALCVLRIAILAPDDHRHDIIEGHLAHFQDILPLPALEDENTVSNCQDIRDALGDEQN